MDLLLMKKRTLFSKIQAVRAHESEWVSWASQLSLQTLAARSFNCESVNWSPKKLFQQESKTEQDSIQSANCPAIS